MSYLTKEDLEGIIKDIEKLRIHISKNDDQYNKFVLHMSERIEILEKIFPAQLEISKEHRILTDFMTETQNKLSKNTVEGIERTIKKLDNSLHNFRKKIESIENDLL